MAASCAVGAPSADPIEHRLQVGDDVRVRRPQRNGDAREAGLALEAVARLGPVNERVLEELRELNPLRGDARYRALRGDR